MTAVGCAKEMEVQIREHGSVGEPVSALSLVSRNSGTSATIHVIGSSGSTGDESSGEEPPLHNYTVPPKKNRLKEPNNNSLSSATASSLVSLIRGASNKDIISVDEQSQDDEDSRQSTKDGGVSTSLTSGENSDTDMGPDGDEHMGMNAKSDDGSKKLFECDVCNMKFSNGANMRRHRMRHTGVKPYECRICQKRFFRKDHLAEHMATHSKLLPFRCPICNKGFQRQIAMRAHFQNEHVGGSHDMVKACPLCSYKAGSMKSLRVHFYSRHGIDLDNPMPHSSSILCSNGSTSASPNPCGTSNGEYSELAQALGFEDREKSSDSSLIPSHFLVPQIEISSNSPYPPHFSFSADSSYNYNQDDRLGGHRSPSPPQNISPQSDSSSSHLPSSTDLLVVKKEVMDETSPEVGEPKSKESSEMSDDIQDMPEDLSSNNSSSCRSHSPKCSSSSLIKVSPLKSLLRDEWRSKESSQGNGTNGTTSRERSDSSSGHSSNSNFHTQAYDGEAITSSNGPENGAHSMYGRRAAALPTPLHQCVYCGIIFPDKTLYFLHKGCHSESNPWRCNICGESCSNVYDFNSHLLSKSHQ
ncbi:unnamed protein product [Orchesella dallaii]|uniref:C2H2-type domain-containing protein n=1 Tax=Orchesella dallaii TaxID=48710 RepID=A0ABP1QYB4_9HEXA